MKIKVFFVGLFGFAAMIFVAGFSNIITDFNKFNYEDNSSYPACLHQSGPIFENDEPDYAVLAYSEYCDPDGPDKDMTVAMFKVGILQHSNEENLNLYQVLKSSTLDMPEFMEIFKSQIDTAAAEKQKSAEELYQLSKTEPAKIEDSGWMDLLEDIYLKLAMDKGHQKAKKEFYKKNF